MGDPKVTILGLEPDLVWEDTSARSLSFFCKAPPPVVVHTALIDDLKRISAGRGGCNVRICLHNGHSDPQHDMIILQHRDHYSRPHKHQEKGEVHHIMEGRVAVVLFADDGRIAAATTLEDGDIYRMGTQVFHLVLPLTRQIVFHESRLGPFVGEAETRFPAWAPDGGVAAAAGVYLKTLYAQLAEHHGIQRDE